MLQKRFFLAAALLLMPVFSFGQVSSQSCAAIADTVAAGYSTTLSQTQLDQLKYYANCESSDSATNVGVNFVYSAFSLGVKYDDAKKNASCTTDASKLNLQTTDYTKVKQIYREGLDVVSQCLQLAARNWSIKYQLYKDAVSFSIANLSPLGNDLKGIDLIGTEAITCKDLPQKYPLTIKADGLSLTCIRTPHSQVMAGATFTEAAEAVVNLRLADGPFAIKLPGYSSSALDGLSKDLASARAEIASVRQDMKKMQTNLKQGGGSDIPAGGGNGAGGTCPAGSYMVGTRFQIDGGGPHGIISNIIPVCQRLNPESN